VCVFDEVGFRKRGEESRRGRDSPQSRVKSREGFVTIDAGGERDFSFAFLE
jgi:hypothetical protein